MSLSNISPPPSLPTSPRPTGQTLPECCSTPTHTSGDKICHTSKSKLPAKLLQAMHGQPAKARYSATLQWVPKTWGVFRTQPATLKRGQHPDTALRNPSYAKFLPNFSSVSHTGMQSYQVIIRVKVMQEADYCPGRLRLQPATHIQPVRAWRPPTYRPWPVCCSR